MRMRDRMNQINGLEDVSTNILKTLNESANLKEARKSSTFNIENRGNYKHDNSNTKRNKFRSSEQAEKNFYKNPTTGANAIGSGTWEKSPNEKSDKYKRNKESIKQYKNLVNHPDSKDFPELTKEYKSKVNDLEKENKGIINQARAKKSKANESANLKEEISEEVIAVAKQIADKIQETGIMNFEDVDNMAAELLGITLDELKNKELDTDVHIALNYQGIDNNFGSGDFYTQEYAEKHPEVLEESVKTLTLRPTSTKLNESDSLELKEEYTIGDLDDLVWSGARDRWLDYTDEQKEFLIDYFVETSGYIDGNIPTTTDFNDFIWFEADDILEENGIGNSEENIEEGCKNRMNEENILGMETKEERKAKEEAKSKGLYSENENLNESDATPEFMEALKNLLNNYCRINIKEMILSEDGNIVTIDGKKVNIEGDSNLAAIKDIVNAVQ